MNDRRIDVCVCGARSEVIETRSVSYGIRRARHCPDCDLKWTTVEVDAAMLGRIVGVLDAINEASEAICTLPTSAELCGDMDIAKSIRCLGKRQDKKAANAIVNAKDAP